MSTPPGPFPAYRQLAGGGHLYRIDADDHFTELQRIGERWVRHVVVARAYPEKVRIVEMLSGAAGRYLPLTAEEWEAAVLRVASRGAGPDR